MMNDKHETGDGGVRCSAWLGDGAMTISVGIDCDHMNWMCKSIPRWWWRRPVRVCLDCGAILDMTTLKPV
jgi:hypothetical protein